MVVNLALPINEHTAFLQDFGLVSLLGTLTLLVHALVLLLMQSIEAQKIEMSVDRLVLTLAKVEHASILIVHAAVLPSGSVAGHVFLSRDLDAMIPLTTDHHEDILQIFCQNILILFAFE